MASQQKAAPKARVWTLVSLPLVAVVVAAVLMLGWGHERTQQAEANDATTDFVMTGPGCTSVDGGVKGTTFCSVPVNSSFAVTVGMANVGSLAGSITKWQAFVSWSAGLTGPGDPSSTKRARVNGCGELGGLGSAVAIILFDPQTYWVDCNAFELPTLADAGLLELTATFEFNCSANPSQETVTMVIDPGAKRDFTRVGDGTTFAADATGSETLTILCVGPGEQVNIHVNRLFSGVKQEGTCWRISHGAAKIPHDVVGDDVGGVKPDCGEPSNLKLFDEDPGPGNLTVTIPGKQRLQFGDIWHVQNSFSPVGNLDPNNYDCDLALGKCTVPKITVVGGLSVDLDTAESGAPLRVTGGAGPGVGVLAGIAATVATIGVVVGGAGWYLRRRAT